MAQVETRRRLIVEGRVQRVWFRESTRCVAEDLGLAGWVRNLADGSVEIVFEGPADKVDEAVAWAHRGPERAVVTAVHAHEEAPAGITGFAIRPSGDDRG